MSWDRRLIGRAGYYIRIRVSPDNPDHLLIANSTLWRSRDGGKIWVSGGGGCGDCHDIWWDTNRGDGRPLHRDRRRRHGHLRIAEQSDRQHERVAADRPDVSRDGRSAHRRTGSIRIAGRRQHAHRERSADRAGERAVVCAAAVAAPPAPAGGAAAARRRRGGGGGAAAVRVPPAARLQRRASRGALRRRWRRRSRRRRAQNLPAQESMPSCESGYTYPEPNNHRFVWGTCYAAHVATFDELSGARRSVSPWMHTLDSDPVGLKYRCHWSPPLAIDWFDNSVYFGCQVIFRTRDRGQNWEVISPDLSTGDPERIRFSGGVVGDNLGQFYGAVVSAIAPSRTHAGVVWAGHERRQGLDLARRRQEVDRPDEEREDAAVGHRAPHRRVAFRSGTAYMAVDYHLVDNRDPYLFKTTDFGQTWTRIDAACRRAIRSTTRCRSPRTRIAAAWSSPARATASSTRATTARRGRSSRTSCRRRRSTGSKCRRTRRKSRSRPTAAASGFCATSGSSSREVGPTAQQAARGDIAIYKPMPGAAQRRRRRGGVRVLAAHGADGADHDGDPRSDRRRDQHEPGAGPRRAERGVVESALSAAGPPGAAIDSARQSAHLGRGALAGPRASGHALGPRRAGCRRAAPGQVHRAHDVQRRAVHAAVRDLARRDAAVDRRRSRRQHRPAARTSSTRSTRSSTRSTASRSCACRSRTCARRTPRTRTLDPALAALYKRMYDTELHFLSRTEMHSDDKWYVEKYKLYLNLVWLLAEIGAAAATSRAASPTGRRCGRERLPGVREGAGSRAADVRQADGRRRGVQQERTRDSCRRFRTRCPPADRAARDLGHDWGRGTSPS